LVQCLCRKAPHGLGGGVSLQEGAQLPRLAPEASEPRREGRSIARVRRWTRDWLHAVQRFHLIPQPTLGFWSELGALPASRLCTAARKSLPVTGTALPGREASNWPRYASLPAASK